MPWEQWEGTMDLHLHSLFLHFCRSRLKNSSQNWRWLKLYKVRSPFPHRLRDQQKKTMYITTYTVSRLQRLKEYKWHCTWVFVVPEPLTLLSLSNSDSGFPLGLENLEKWEGIFQSGKSQGILNKLEKSGKITQNTEKLREFEINMIWYF